MRNFPSPTRFTTSAVSRKLSADAGSWLATRRNSGLTMTEDVGFVSGFGCFVFICSVKLLSKNKGSMNRALFMGY